MSKDEFVSEIANLRDRVKINLDNGKPPVVLIYYSGHGFMYNGLEYLINSDSLAYRPDDLTAFLASSISIDEAAESVGPTLATIVFVDACREVISQSGRNLKLPSEAESTGTLGGGVAGAKTVLTGQQYIENTKTITNSLYVYANTKGKVVRSYSEYDGYYSPFAVAMGKSLGLGNDLLDELENTRESLQNMNVGQELDTEHLLSGKLYLYFNLGLLNSLRE